MLVAAFALAALLTLSEQALPRAAHPSSAGAVRTSKPGRARAAAALERRFGPVGDLYSSRAKRRIASYLRMRLLELRLRGLERASEAIEHRLPLDVLLHDEF